MSYKWRCTGEGNKFKLWPVLLFQKGLNLCLFTISTIVSIRTMKLSRLVAQTVGCLWWWCGGVASGSDGLGGREDVTTN